MTANCQDTTIAPSVAGETKILHFPAAAVVPTAPVGKRRRPAGLPEGVVRLRPRPPLESRDWRYTPSGRLLPRTHRFDRIHLGRWHASREWIELGEALDRATDAVAEAHGDGLDLALNEWRRLAFEAIICKAPEAELRTKIALAAVVSGHKHSYGCIHDHPDNLASLAFAALDHAVCVARMAAEEKVAKSRQGKPSRRTGQPQSRGRPR